MGFGEPENMGEAEYHAILQAVLFQQVQYLLKEAVQKCQLHRFRGVTLKSN